MVRKSKDNLFWLVAVVAAFLFFFNLGSIPLLDPDEPVYAETPKEMLAFADLVSPRIYGEYWYDKPPLYYWLVAGAFQVFGVNEFSARFPSAFLGLLTVMYVYWSAKRHFGSRAAVASALILATSIEFFYLTKAAVTDITLNFCLTVALLSFLEKRYSLFYIFAGLATLAKGPVGILFPGAILFFYFLLTRQWRQIKEMKVLHGIMLYAATALPWYIMMYGIHGSPFVETFIGFHNITRFTSPEHAGVTWYYFIPVLILGFFPWTAVMVQSVWASMTKRGNDRNALLFLNIWTWFIFLFFTVSRTKLVSYILPMFVPLAMITGWYVASLMEKRIRLRSWPVLLVLLALLFSAAIVYGSTQMPELTDGAYAVSGVFLVMAAAAAYFLWNRRVKAALWIQVTGMTAFVVILMTMLLPAVVPVFTAKEIAVDVKTHYDGKSPLYVVKFLRPGLAFYTDLYGIEVEANWGKTLLLNDVVKHPGKAYYLIRQSHYDRLPPEQKQFMKVLAQRGDRFLLLKER